MIDYHFKENMFPNQELLAYAMSLQFGREQ